MTRTHNTHIFGEIPFSSHKTTQHINDGEKKSNPLCQATKRHLTHKRWRKKTSCSKKCRVTEGRRRKIPHSHPYNKEKELTGIFWDEKFRWLFRRTDSSSLTLVLKVNLKNRIKKSLLCVSIQGSRWDQEQGGGSGPSAQKRSWAGRWSWAAKVGLLSLRVVPQQQCNGHCLYDCPSTAVETAIAQCTSRWAMARGHRLNISIVLAAVHGLSGLFRAVSSVEPSLFAPPPPAARVPNKHPRFCGRKAKWYIK